MEILYRNSIIRFEAKRNEKKKRVKQFKTGVVRFRIEPNRPCIAVETLLESLYFKTS